MHRLTFALALALALPSLAPAQQPFAAIGSTWTYTQGSCCGPDTNVAVIQFSIEVRDRNHLADVIRRVRRLGVVHGVQRL